MGCSELQLRTSIQGFLGSLQDAASGASATPYPDWMKRGGAVPENTSTNRFEYWASHKSGSCGPPSAAMMAGMVLLWPTTRTASPAATRSTAAATESACASRMPVGTMMDLAPVFSAIGAAVS